MAVQYIRNETSENTPKMTKNERLVANIQQAATSILFARENYLRGLLDRKKDINKECDYPDTLFPIDYKLMYEREGIAARVVNIEAAESWVVDPEIKEDLETKNTDFEEAWEELNEEHNIIPYLQRMDEISGIGSYGVMLIGLDDGEPLDQPVPGMDATGLEPCTERHKLLYLRTFDEYLVQILQYETDTSSPRYGQPTLYRLTFMQTRVGDTGVSCGTNYSLNVHWSRVCHFADNRLNSELFGTPRMRPVWNRLYDIRKILSSSAEMFWKGGFPGLAFEVNPDIASTIELDKDSLRTEFNDYSSGLQRYLALVGVQVKSLAPQIVAPDGHLSTQLKAIAVSLSIPMRVFLGSEESRLSSAQDMMTWNRRVRKRQTKYVGPWVVRSFIQRLVAAGVLPKPKRLMVDWPDLNTPTDADKAKVASLYTDAMVKYVKGGVMSLVAPRQFLTVVLGLSKEQAEMVIKNWGTDESPQLRAISEAAQQKENGGGTGAGGTAFRGSKTSSGKKDKKTREK